MRVKNSRVLLACADKPGAHTTLLISCHLPASSLSASIAQTFTQLLRFLSHFGEAEDKSETKQKKNIREYHKTYMLTSLLHLHFSSAPSCLFTIPLRHCEVEFKHTGSFSYNLRHYKFLHLPIDGAKFLINAHACVPASLGLPKWFGCFEDNLKLSQLTFCLLPP